MAKKTSKKKKEKKAGAPKVTHIYYECQGSACVESMNQANVGAGGSVVVLSAIGTDVTLNFFSLAGSPFKGGKTSISIKADKSKHMVVDAGAAHMAYPYNVSCDACSTPRPPAPPEMIVP